MEFFYILGICVASIGATKLPAEGSTWSDILYVFNDGVILTIVGLVIWRQAPIEQEEEETENKRTALQLIRDIQPILDDLYRNVDDLECYQIQEYVKYPTCTVSYAARATTWSDHRRQGVGKDSRIADRDLIRGANINRIHSAALDGHHDEVVECTEEAHAAFKEVFELTVRVWKFENKPT